MGEIMSSCKVQSYYSQRKIKYHKGYACISDRCDNCKHDLFQREHQYCSMLGVSFLPNSDNSS